jgi:hypothetical protein
MAGTLTISTLSDGTNSTSATNPIKGSAKAWVQFDGVTTATIRASYNVSSITRNAAGDYTVNYTNAFADANYSFVGTSTSTGAIFTVVVANTQPTGAIVAPTTTTTRFVTTNIASVVADVSYINVAVFR